MGGGVPQWEIVPLDKLSVQAYLGQGRQQASARKHTTKSGGVTGTAHPSQHGETNAKHCPNTHAHKRAHTHPRSVKPTQWRTFPQLWGPKQSRVLGSGGVRWQACAALGGGGGTTTAALRSLVATSHCSSTRYAASPKYSGRVRRRSSRRRANTAAPAMYGSGDAWSTPCNT